MEKDPKNFNLNSPTKPPLSLVTTNGMSRPEYDTLVTKWKRLQKSKNPLTEAEIQDGQRRWKEYNGDLDKMIELGKKLIKLYDK